MRGPRFIARLSMIGGVVLVLLGAGIWSGVGQHTPLWGRGDWVRLVVILLIVLGVVLILAAASLYLLNPRPGEVRGQPIRMPPAEDAPPLVPPDEEDRDEVLHSG